MGAKENSDVAIVVGKKRGAASRKHVRSAYEDILPASKVRESYSKGKETKDKHRKSRVLQDLTDKTNNTLPTSTEPRSKATPSSISKGSQDRVKAFERLKELERSKFLEEEDEEDSYEHVEKDENAEIEFARDNVIEEEEGQVVEVPRLSTSQLLPTPTTGGLSTTVHDTTAATPSSYYSKHLVDSIFSEIRNTAEVQASVGEAKGKIRRSVFYK